MLLQERYKTLVEQYALCPSADLGMNAHAKNECIVSIVEEGELVFPLLLYVASVDITMGAATAKDKLQRCCELVLCQYGNRPLS